MATLGKVRVFEMSVYEMVMTGLDDSIAFSKGERLSLVTVQIPGLPDS